MFSHALLAGLALLSAAGASPLELQARDCSHDNLYRCFVDKRYSVLATDYCAVLTYTSTIATTTATATATASTTTTVSTETDVLPRTETVWSTVPSSTVTVTRVAAQKRAAATSVAGPACVTNYPLSRLTSACSCISVPAKTISVTYTAGTVTITSTATISATAITATTAWTTISSVTTTGVQTVTVDAPSPSVTNGNFESGSVSPWTYYGSDSSAWSSSVVQAVGANGASSYVFVLSNFGNSGYALMQQANNMFHLATGSTYRLSYQVKNTYYGAQTSYSHMTANLQDGSGRGIIGTVSGGTIIDNGWVQFQNTITVDSSYSVGNFYLRFQWARDSVSSQYLIDNVLIELV